MSDQAFDAGSSKPLDSTSSHHAIEGQQERRPKVKLIFEEAGACSDSSEWAGYMTLSTGRGLAITQPAQVVAGVYGGKGTVQYGNLGNANQRKSHVGSPFWQQWELASASIAARRWVRIRCKHAHLAAKEKQQNKQSRYADHVCGQTMIMLARAMGMGLAWKNNHWHRLACHILLRASPWWGPDMEPGSGSDRVMAVWMFVSRTMARAL